MTRENLQLHNYIAYISKDTKLKIYTPCVIFVLHQFLVIFKPSKNLVVDEVDDVKLGNCKS